MAQHDVKDVLQPEAGMTTRSQGKSLEWNLTVMPKRQLLKSDEALVFLKEIRKRKSSNMVLMYIFLFQG